MFLKSLLIDVVFELRMILMNIFGLRFVVAVSISISVVIVLMVLNIRLLRILMEDVVLILFMWVMVCASGVSIVVV